MAQQQSMSLVVVPCWWDGSLQRLVATIEFQRPDITSLLQDITEIDKEDIREPILLNPSSSFFEAPEIPGIGELMLASLPHYKFEIPPTTIWWLGEKYDGVRCCWNEPLQQVLFPSNLKCTLPSVSVDSEIWFGRRQCTTAYQVISGNQAVTGLSQFNLAMLRLISFDVPSVYFQQQPYETRYAHLLLNIDIVHPMNIVVPRMSCTSNVLIDVLTNHIISDGGEGVILQKESSRYEPGRSLSLLKIKSLHGEKEGIVIGIGERKSVLIKLPNGVPFVVPAHNVHIHTPTVGDIVTLTSEINMRYNPANSVITRKRTDMTWNDVVYNSYTEQPPDATSSIHNSLLSLPVSFWTHENMRAFMESYVKSKNMNPFTPETWYSSFSDFRKIKIGRAIIRKFSGYFQALRQLFPEIELSRNAFSRAFWVSIDNRRKFFDNYAQEHEFNPLQPTSWYLQLKENILAARVSFKFSFFPKFFDRANGSRRVLAYHSNSIVKALLDLFPNIGLQRQKLFTRPASVWRNIATHTTFFEKYAKQNGFDPLHPLEWYEQPKAKIMATKGAANIMYFYNNKVSQALLHVFPNIGLEKSKLKLANLWHRIEVRKKFFENFAEYNGFDPYQPNNWYAQSKQNIMAAKGAYRVIAYHRNSISSALVDLFPDIGLDKSRFKQALWQTAASRRMFFDTYAVKNNFDALLPDNWYSQSKDDIMAMKGARGVISYHNNSLSKALLDLLPNIGLDKTKLHFRSAFHAVANRRKVFEDYAKEKGFNSTRAEHWHKMATENILNNKRIRDVLIYYNHSIPKALLDLFPDIGLDKALLK